MQTLTNDLIETDCLTITPAGLEALETLEDAENAPDGQETRFVIDCEDRANWFLRKLALIEAEREIVRAQAADIIAGLDRDAAGLRARFEADLEAWTREELARRGGKGKTLKLLRGTVALRTVPASLRITGTGEALEYAKAQGWEAVRTVETLDKDVYRREAEAARQESGELLPGVEVVPARENFSIRFPGEKSAPAED